MQGHESSITAFPENLSFDHSSSSSDASIEPQMPRNSMQNHLQELMMSSGETSAQVIHQARHESLTFEHALGETSSSAGQSQGDHHIERNGDHQYESTNNIPFDDVNLSANGIQIASGSSHPPLSGSEVFSRDLNPRLNIGDWEDDDGQVIESEEVPGSSFDGQSLPCKRKALETTQTGSSSGAGSSNLYQQTDQNNAGSSIMPAQIANDLDNDNETGQASNQRPMRLDVDGSLSMSSQRSVRLRIDGPHQQDHTPKIFLLNNANAASVDISSLGSRHVSRLSLPNPLLEPSPIPATVDRYMRESLGLSYVSYARRNSRSSRSEASGSRAQSSSASAISDENSATMREDPFLADPVLIPAIETGGSSQRPINEDSASGNNGNNNNNHANVGPSSSRAGSNWNTPLYNQRVSEFVRRRSLLFSASTGAEGQRPNHVLIPGPSSSSSSIQETTLSSGISSRMQRGIAFLERRLEDAPGLPQSSQMARIRHLLGLVRRGEDLTLEDVMLNRSIFFNIADLNDRHRDMRMDVDNMSYEELLALGEKIGDVCTGLKEEIIMSHLKQRKFMEIRPKDVETEPCSICREEYSGGDDIGTLDCGHDFHIDCVKQWLALKNLCPICKTTGLNHHHK